MLLRFTTALSRNVARTATARRCFVAHLHTENESMAFPQGSVGMDYDLNWSLNADGITPRGDTYHNITAEALGEEISFEGKDTTINEVGVDIRYGEFESFSNSVLETLSTAPKLYTQDGAVGSAASDRSRVRVISDSPAVAQLAQKLLTTMPRSFDHDSQIVVYVASNADAAETTAVMLVDEDQATEGGVTPVKVLFSGIPSSKTFIDAISRAKETLMSNDVNRRAVLLPCDMMTLDGKTAMVFNASESSKTSGVTSNMLSSAHYAIWSQDGVSPLFGGAVVKGHKSLEGGFSVDGGKVAIAHPTENLLDHPAALVFVGASKKVSTKKAVEIISKTSPNLNTAVLEELIQERSPALLGAGSKADISKLVSKA